MTRRSCEQCGREYTLVKGFVYRSELPHAVYYVACHHHDAAREAWIDVILGTFGVDDWGDHVTFGARVGPIAGQSEPGATLVDAAAPYGDSEMFGMKLTRAAALQHERLSEYWDIVDFILMEDPTVYAHVYQ